MGSIYFDNNSDFMFHVERHGDPASEPLRSGKISCVKQKDGEDGWGRDIAYKFVATEEEREGQPCGRSPHRRNGRSGAGQASPPTGTPNMLESLREAIREHGSAGKVHVDKWRDVGLEPRGFLDDDATKRSKQVGDCKSEN